MDQPGSEAVGIGVEADVNISELFAGAERWRRTLEAWPCGAPRCYDNSRDNSGAVHFYVHPRNLVTLSAMDVKDRSSPVDSTRKKWHPEGPRSVCCSFCQVRRKAKLWMSLSRFLKSWRTFFRPSLIASGVYPWMECLGLSSSNAKTWDEGAAMWIDEHGPWVIVATWSTARHASKVALQRSALANNSDIFTSATAPMPTASDPSRSITPGPRRTLNQSPPLQKMKYIQIKCKIHQTWTHYNTHFLRAPFFSYVHTVHSLRL